VRVARDFATRIEQHFLQHHPDERFVFNDQHFRYQGAFYYVSHNYHSLIDALNMLLG
jgi:hypothetical protein